MKVPHRNEVALTDALSHWREAFGLAFQLCGESSRAEDLCQEAFARLAGIARPLDTGRSLRPLILKIVRNLFYSEERRDRPESLDLAIENLGPLSDPAASTPIEALCRSEDLDLVREALAQLHESWRATLYLRDGLDLSYREIAAILEISVDVVRVTLHRARQRMRAALSTLVTGENDR